MYPFKNMKRTYFLATAFVVALFIIGATSWLLFTPSQNIATNLERESETMLASTTQPKQTSTSAMREAPKGYREYRNLKYRFSLFYPESLSVKEIDEGGGAATITFQNEKTVEGFQIFIVPFAGSQITDERFRKDIPSGVRENLQNIEVDGAVGLVYSSWLPVRSEHL
jgi:hypothetical protein